MSLAFLMPAWLFLTWLLAHLSGFVSTTAGTGVAIAAFFIAVITAAWLPAVALVCGGLAAASLLAAGVNAGVEALPIGATTEEALLSFGVAGSAAIVALWLVGFVRVIETRHSDRRAAVVAWPVELAVVTAGATVAAFAVAGIWTPLVLLCAPPAGYVVWQLVELFRHRRRAAVSQLSAPEVPEVGAASRGAGGDHESDRSPTVRQSPAPDPETPPAPEQALPREHIEDLLAELDSYVGLTSLKRQVREFVARETVAQRRREHGLETQSSAIHLRMDGPPGTGKTEMARLLARILRALGVVEGGQFIEVDRGKLVGQHVGATAPKTEAAVEEALGGVLFIDEAYSLGGTSGGGVDPFGAEAVATLLKLMEDRRGEFVCILAGYPDEMDRLMDTNPGLASRIGVVLTFDEYLPSELLKIADGFVHKSDYELEPAARAELAGVIKSLYANRDRRWANARTVRQLLEATTAAHAVRVAAITDADRQKLRTLTVDDVGAGADRYRETRGARPSDHRSANHTDGYGFGPA